jgi:uncharacterized membrane protein
MAHLDVVYLVLAVLHTVQIVLCLTDDCQVVLAVYEIDFLEECSAHNEIDEHLGGFAVVATVQFVTVVSVVDAEERGSADSQVEVAVHGIDFLEECSAHTEIDEHQGGFDAVGTVQFVTVVSVVDADERGSADSQVEVAVHGIDILQECFAHTKIDEH